MIMVWIIMYLAYQCVIIFSTEREKSIYQDICMGKSGKITRLLQYVDSPKRSDFILTRTAYNRQ